MPGVWTADQIKQLRSLWSKGETAAAIGVRLGGLSRSAVLEKIYRLRLHTELGPLETPAKKRKRIVRARPGAEGLARRRRRTRYRKRKPEIPAAAPVRHYKSIFQLTNITCRWPHGRPGGNRFFFCGLPEADLERGIPYCPRHMQRAYPNGVCAPALPRTTAARTLYPWR
jgi:GcrA cell cycle regulator